MPASRFFRRFLSALAAILTLQSARADVIYSPGAPSGSFDVFPWVQNVNTTQYLLNPGTLFHTFDVPGYHILTSVELNMLDAPNPTGGFSLSLHTLTTDNGSSFDLPLEATLTGSSNPSTAGTYAYTGMVPLDPGSTYGILAQVSPGGGTYTISGAGDPAIGGGQFVYIFQELPIGLTTNPDPFRLNDLVLFTGIQAFSFTVNATPVNIDGGLQFANLQGEALLAGGRTVLNDLNNRLFNLRAGRDRPKAGSGLVSTLDGAGPAGSENPESPIANRGSSAGEWEAFTMVNFGDFELKGTGGNVDTWAPGIGVERELAPGLNLGFAASFLSSRQEYVGGLGGFDFEGPVLSAYLSKVTGNFWNDFLYSHGTYDMDSVREGLGNPAAFGSTEAESHAAQYNLGWYFPTEDETIVTGPFAGIDYFHGEINGYTETGGGVAGLIFTGQTVESLITRLGWSISKTMEMDQATVTAQARLSYERQNLDNNEAGVSAINAPSLNVAGINRPVGQDYVVAGLGVRFDFDSKVSLLMSYQGQFFRNNVEDHLGGVTFSVPF